MTGATFHRPRALLAKAALIGDARHRFDCVVVENDHGTVVLRGYVRQAQMIGEAGHLAANAAGSPVRNRILVAP